MPRLALDDVTDTFITGPPGHQEAPADGTPGVDPRLRRVTVPTGPGDARSVFLVRGRDDAKTKAIADFLRVLDLKVIEWEQAVAMTGEPNPYIGDVIVAGSGDADGVVVLANTR